MFKRYELHNHTDQSDARISCRELIDHMLADKVDCFAITDHNTTSGQTIIRKLLTEMDGLETRQQVFIMAATNRPGKKED